MAIPFNAATSAYGNTQKLLGGGLKGASDGAAGGAKGPDFASFLSGSLQNVTEVGRASDAASLDLVNGRGNVVDMVTAVSQTELAVETLVTVRDRVISAYEEIMRMPI